MANTTFTIRPSADGNQYSQYPLGDFNPVIPAPSNLVVTISGTDGVLSWGNTVPGATVRLQRSISINSGWENVATIAAGISTYTDGGLSAGAYYWRALHNNGVIDSAWSNTASGVVSTGAWQLPIGYFMQANQAMIRMYPRPDGEVSANAYHRKAYYDGVNQLQYRVPVGVAFGAPPYRFDVITGPSGLTVGQFYGLPDYGYVTWVPSGSVSNATVTIRVTDQQLSTIDVTWTVSTSSSTADFIFISNSGSNSNSGAIESPLQTIAGAFGATFSATANPGARAVLRAGTYVMPTYTDGSINSSYTSLEFHKTRKPLSLIAYTGEAVTISGTSSRIVCAGNTGEDAFFQNLNFSGFMSSANNYRLFWSYASRFTADNVQWSGAGQGAVGDDNATMFFSSIEGSVFADYLFIKNCGETGRTSGGANNYGFCSLYSRRYGLIEGCTFRGAAYAVAYVKGTNFDMCQRYNDFQSTSGSEIASEGFAPNGLPNRIEWCYNKLKANNGWSAHALESGMLNLWFKRNTCYGFQLEFNTPNANGPYQLQDNVIVSNQSTLVQSGTQVTNTGTECQGNTAAGIVNATTLELQGAYQTYDGRRGHKISQPA